MSDSSRLRVDSYELNSSRDSKSTESTRSRLVSRLDISTLRKKRHNILGGHVLSQNEYEKLSPKRLTAFLVATLGLCPNTAQNI
jgi:hypothetical protein